MSKFINLKLIAAFVFVFSSFQVFALNGVTLPGNYGDLTRVRDDLIPFPEMKKSFEAAAKAEGKTVPEVVVELQKLDPDYASELVKDEDFFKLSYLLANGWDVTFLNNQAKDLLVVAIEQGHMAILQAILKSGGWKIVRDENIKDILKKAGQGEYSYYEHTLKEWKNPTAQLYRQPESYEYRVDGESRREKAIRLALPEAAPMAPAGGAGPEEPKFFKVDVPYATNRETNQKFKNRLGTPDGAEAYYSYTNASETTYGVATITIPKTHEKGKLEDRGVFEIRRDASKHIILQRLSLLSHEDFFKDLAEKIKARETAMPDVAQAKDVFLYVHGFNVDFSYAIRKTAQMMYDMDYPGVSMAFSWPARAVAVPMPWDFQSDVRKAYASVSALESFLSDMLDRFPDRRIHIIAHSLGTRVLSNVLVNIAKSRNIENIAEGAKKLFGEVILAAPAIDAELFVNNWSKEITPLCERISVLASDDDYALKLQFLAEDSSFSFPLGLWDEARGQLALTDGVANFDLSLLSAGTFSLDHSVYSEVPVALDHMKLLVTHSPKEADLKNSIYMGKWSAMDYFTRKAKDFWKFLAI